MRKGRLRTLASYTASVVIVLGLVRLYAAYSRAAADAQWYLLTPPVGENLYEPDVTAPLWNWAVRESYASRKGCETARAHKLAQFAKESESLKALVKLDRCVAANTRGVPHSDYWWHAHPENLIDRNPPPRNALSRLLNHIAADSRTHPGMSLVSRLFEYWAPLLFAALFIYYPINLVVGVYSGADSSRQEAATLADALVALECLTVGFVLGIWILVAILELLILPAGRYLTARGLGFVAWVVLPVAWMPLLIVVPPIARRLDQLLARLEQLLPSSPTLTRAMRWWSVLAIAGAAVTFAGQDPGGPEGLPNLRWLWVLAALASPLWPLSQVVERRLKSGKIWAV